MTTILFVWALSGFAGTQFTTHEKYDWKYMGSYSSISRCADAARALGYPDNNFRCVLK